MSGRREEPCWRGGSGRGDDDRQEFWAYRTGGGERHAQGGTSKREPSSGEGRRGPQGRAGLDEYLISSPGKGRSRSHYDSHSSRKDDLSEEEGGRRDVRGPEGGTSASADNLRSLIHTLEEAGEPGDSEELMGRRTGGRAALLSGR